MKDTDPQVIGFHLQLGDQVMRLDCMESRVWDAGNRGLYIAPGSSEHIAGNVVLTLAYIALGRSK